MPENDHPNQIKCPACGVYSPSDVPRCPWCGAEITEEKAVDSIASMGSATSIPDQPEEGDSNLQGIGINGCFVILLYLAALCMPLLGIVSGFVIMSNSGSNPSLKSLGRSLLKFSFILFGINFLLAVAIVLWKS